MVLARALLVTLTLALGLLAAPLAADAQPPGKVPRIGYLQVGGRIGPRDEAFLQGLRQLGYIEGKNVAIESRYAEGKTDRLPELAAELIRLKVDVIVTSAVGIAVAKKATSTIPIVMANQW